MSEHPEPEWRPVSPRLLQVQLGSTALAAVAAAAAALLLWWLDWWGGFGWIAPAAIAVLLLVSLPLLPRRVRAIGFRLRQDDLVLRRGVLFRRQVAVPYGRMQLIDITRGPIARRFGLSTLRFVTAAVSSDVSIPGLPAAEAEQLRDELVGLAEQRRAGL